MSLMIEKALADSLHESLSNSRAHCDSCATTNSITVCPRVFRTSLSAPFCNKKATWSFWSIYTALCSGVPFPVPLELGCPLLSIALTSIPRSSRCAIISTRPGGASAPAAECKASVSSSFRPCSKRMSSTAGDELAAAISSMCAPGTPARLPRSVGSAPWSRNHRTSDTDCVCRTDLPLA